MLRHLFRPRNVRQVSSLPNVLRGIGIPEYLRSFRLPCRYVALARSNAVLRSGNQQ